MFYKINGFLILFCYAVLGTAQPYSPELFRGVYLPNDPLMLPNSFMPYHQYHLNIQANGMSLDYPATWVLARGHALIGVADINIDANHPDILGNLRQHLSSNDILSVGNTQDHGSWVLGVLAPTSNNNEGLSAVCQNCSIAAEMYYPFGGGTYLSLMRSGVQAINVSSGSWENNEWSCDNTSDLCQTLANDLVERDVIVVSISQNRSKYQSPSLYYESFPASLPSVINVGGLDTNLNFWNDCDGFEDSFACGSYTSIHQELVAPAKDIVTAVTYPGPAPHNCGNLIDYGIPYNRCSGNSFAAPQVTGLIGIIRSVYPQLSADNVRLLLQETAQSPYTDRTEEWGYGMINPLASVSAVLGESQDVQQVNRVIPFFAVRSPDSGGSQDVQYLNHTAYSSSPQFIAAALAADLRSYNVYYEPLDVGMALNNYHIPASNLQPYAAFHILGTHNNPLVTGQELIKLYRLSKYQEENGLSVDYAYVTEDYLAQFTSLDYVVDTIEGYVFPPCTIGDNTCTVPPHTECLYARNLAGSMDDWTIMLASQTNHNAYLNHTVELGSQQSDICLGYAFQPIDSDFDGLIDGYEAFLGTDIYNSDSDADGRTDGDEMLIPIDGFFSDPMIFNDLIFENDFETSL